MENKFEYITYKEKVGKAVLKLNRPLVHNALNYQMLVEINEVVKLVSTNDTVEVLVISGKGKSFCAGADISWFAGLRDLPVEKQKEQLNILPQVLWSLYNCPKPTIAQIHGLVIGGGIGLIAACDFVISTKNAQLALKEVQLGITPSTISPFVFEKTGVKPAQQLMLTGEFFDASYAQKIGLITANVKENKVKKATGALIDKLSLGGNDAKANIKTLGQMVGNKFVTKQNLGKTLTHLIKMLNSEEASSRLDKFISKKTISESNE